VGDELLRQAGRTPMCTQSSNHNKKTAPKVFAYFTTCALWFSVATAQLRRTF